MPVGVRQSGRAADGLSGTGLTFSCWTGSLLRSSSAYKYKHARKFAEVFPVVNARLDTRSCPRILQSCWATPSPRHHMRNASTGGESLPFIVCITTERVTFSGQTNDASSPKTEDQKSQCKCKDKCSRSPVANGHMGGVDAHSDAATIREVSLLSSGTASTRLPVLSP